MFIQTHARTGIEEFTFNVVSSGGSGLSSIIDQVVELGIPGFPTPALLLGLVTIALMVNIKSREHH